MELHQGIKSEKDRKLKEKKIYLQKDLFHFLKYGVGAIPRLPSFTYLLKMVYIEILHGLGNFFENFMF